MGLKSILRGLAPVAAIAFAAAATGGCDKMHVSIDGEEGKRLSELDLGGTAPDQVVLAGPDTVRISTGERLAIDVTGDAGIADKLRFTLDEGKLGIMREDGKWAGGKTVTVNVTMPAPRRLTIAGSGRIDSADLAADEARVTIAGSGTVETPRVATESLRVDIAGSGSYRAAGTARNLRLAIAGSGDARLKALKIDEAKVDIAGSGDSSFASDGTVRANIVGSGAVRVIGRATCKVKSMGSGSLVCEPGPDSAATKPADDEPIA